ncbi:MAG: nitronate monooxygenase [Candidatus Abyssobacteria bacterium SURF_17]|uniref:Nitronate monooxygenase n=1 Tax=Candidatus Abyssobacteria bacterium SURF_17 TaxID=2093361 RepID=A0A419F4Q2_9BACT|nr:MAG: nitronate monooxygenase [Candidatus Abyssubacteria bacterium SURF_17]
MIRTKICEILGIDHPILLAGMGGVSFSALTAAVSKAGGMGVLGAAAMEPDFLRQEIRTIKSITNKPFGVDLLMPLPDMLEAQMEVIYDETIPVFVSGLGIPSEIIEEGHRRGMKVLCMIGKVAHALRAKEAGADVIVAQGTEAGGHTGKIGTLALVPQVVDATGLPVLAAGGIGDGRGLAAALTLGACGVVMGTRFIATPEARASDTYRKSLVDARDEDTFVTRCYTGKTLRAISNDYVLDWESHAQDLKKFPQQILVSMEAGVLSFITDGEIHDATRQCMPAGQVTGMIHEVKPAADIVTETVAQAERILKQYGAIVA